MVLPKESTPALPKAKLLYPWAIAPLPNA